MGRSKTEFNNLGIPRAALYTLNWLRIMRGGAIRTNVLCETIVLCGWWSEPHVRVMRNTGVRKGQGGCLSRISIQEMEGSCVCTHKGRYPDRYGCNILVLS